MSALPAFRHLDGQFPQLSKLWQTQSDKSGQPEELSGAAEEQAKVGIKSAKVDKRRSKRIGSTDHLLKMLHKVLLAFAGDFGCAGEAHAPRADGGVLADFKEF